MLPTISFSKTNDVLESWMLLQTLPNYADDFGVRLFRKFFDMYPEAISVFSFGSDTTSLVENDEFFKSPRFLLHARFFMRTFSGAIDMLGPSLDVLYATFAEIGERHRRYGVTKQHYNFMEIALIDTFEEMLEGEFKNHHRMAWEKAWKVMSYAMRNG